MCIYTARKKKGFLSLTPDSLISMDPSAPLSCASRDVIGSRGILFSIDDIRG